MDILRALLAALLLLSSPLRADDDIRTEHIKLAAGASSATISGQVSGRESVDYLLDARAGQKLVAVLDADSRMAYFNVLPPGSDEAIFIGSTLGERYEGVLPSTGSYTLRVYLMAAGGRRGESSRYTLAVALTGDGAPDPAGTSAAFKQAVSLHGISFEVSSPNSPHGNTLRVVPSGLSIDNSAIEQPIDGVVTGAEIADLDIDRSPEVYVYIREPGAAQRMSLAAWSANRRRSLSGIHLPALDEAPGASSGYAGHDDMAVVESVFMRRFPIGGGRMRQLQYRLAQGEAGWLLKLDQMLEF
jgi:hypothetical protein